MFRDKPWCLTISLCVLLPAGCGPSANPTAANGDAARTLNSNEKEFMTMKITSTAFENGAAIPAKYTGVGDDVSPPLAWSGAPDGTKSLALICDDPDAPSRAKPRPEGPWVHWVLYNVPAATAELGEAVPRVAEPPQPAGARQGKNDFGSDNVGYRGPMPPKGSGPHRYYFKIYALDAQLDLAPQDATKKSLLTAMQGHVLAEGELMGTFERK